VDDLNEVELQEYKIKADNDSKRETMVFKPWKVESSNEKEQGKNVT